MINVRVPSRFGDNKLFLQAQLSQRAEGFTVSEISSPIPYVNDNYNEEVNSNFNYSFVDESGYHEIVGREGEPLRNLLVLLARQTSSLRRNVIFDLDDDVATSIIKNIDFQTQLKTDPGRTFKQIEAMFSGDVLPRVGVWLFYFYHAVLQSEGECIANRIAECLMMSVVIAEVIHTVDNCFFFNHAPRNSYLNARNEVSSGNVSRLNILNYLNLGNASNDVHWRVGDNIRIAARSMKEHRQMTGNDLEKVLNIFSESTSIHPSFLPTTRRAAAAALNILGHFENNLPSWVRVCSEIGVTLHKVELESPILGLFLSNPEAHQAAIFINVSRRSEGSQNYTIAHEIGHYLLHYDKCVIECNDEAVYFPAHSSDIEIEANTFASELLMPANLFRRQCIGTFNSEKVNSLSSMFKVSKEAAARRMIDILSNRRLALFVVSNCTITSMIASVINDQGVRWVGKSSVGNQATDIYSAIQLFNNKETNLYHYLSDIDPDKEWLHDLDINIHPFQKSDGYYLFVEAH